VGRPRPRFRVVVKGAVAGALVAALLGLSVQGQEATPKPGPPPKLFAFLSTAGGTELDHLRRYGPRISVIAPNWYELNLRAQSLSGGPAPTVVTLTRAAGAQLWPVVNARLTGGQAIGGTKQRGLIAAAIATEAARRGYQGMTLDIEQLPADYSRAFDALVEAIAARLHAQQERLAVYVPRRTAHGGDQSYDWPTLLKSVDLLVVSGYDEHSATSRPGAVTSAAGFEEVLGYGATLSRARVVPAVGAFGYAWPVGGGPGEFISTVAADALRTRTGATLRGAGGDTSFVADGLIVHYENTPALIARARDARALRMRWLALFSLGREPDAFWAGITTARQIRDGG
jgi:spore germination protein YaaH